MWQFAIKKDTLKSGLVIFTPVARNKATKLLTPPWTRITKEYDKYCLKDLDWNPTLSREECIEHIDGYKKVIIDKESDKIDSVTYDMLEENLRVA